MSICQIDALKCITGGGEEVHETIHTLRQQAALKSLLILGLGLWSGAVIVREDPGGRGKALKIVEDRNEIAELCETSL